MLRCNLPEGGSVKDINLVLRDKRVQLAELALEINGLEAVATALRSVVHLLSDEDASLAPSTRLSVAGEAPPTIPGDARVAQPERSRMRSWV